MQILMVNGSPHKKGTTAQALAIVREALEKENVGVLSLHVGNQPLQGCIGCGRCKKEGRCMVAEDVVNSAIELMQQADGLVIGSPVYYGSVAGGCKCFLDRFFYAGSVKKIFRGKAGAAVVALRRAGALTAFHDLNSFLHLGQMVLPSSPYWHMIHGHDGEEAMQDEEGVQVMRSIGKNMAWLMRCLAHEAMPAEEKRIYTNFIR